MIEHMISSVPDRSDALRERLRDASLDELDDPDEAGALRESTVSLSRADLVRASAEVDLARLIGSVAASGAFREDGHTTVAGWCRATRRWSEAETRVRVRLARLLVLFPDLGDDLIAGRLGVAQANTIAKAAANPRCGDQIGDGAPLCPHRNRFKNHGYRVHRDPTDHWHTYRPDGTEI